MSGILQALLASGGKEAPPTTIGQSYGGGYYAGKITQGGVEYYLVVAPKASGEATRQWKTSDTSTTGTASVINGPSNTNNMNNTTHPAAYFCAGLVINGYDDWYMPAQNELEVMYYNLKPTTTSNVTSSGINANAVPARSTNYTTTVPAQTSAAIFRSGGSEAFGAVYYNSSTEFTNGVSVWRALGQSFSNGDQAQISKTQTTAVRAVRRVAV